MNAELSPFTIEQLQDFAKPAVHAGLINSNELKTAVKILRGFSTGTATTERPRPGLLTAKQAAERLSCCPKTILRMAADGALSRVYLRAGKPKSLRFSEAEINAIAEGGAEL